MSDIAVNGHIERYELASSGWLTRLTVADGLYALVMVAAAVMRLVDLGQIPLSPREAEAALASWQFWQPGTAAITSSSPAYFTLTSLVTPVLGYSDAVMRLIPALFGLGLVALPWFLRQRMGHIGALVAGLLLAVSPLQAVTARAAGGETIALFALLLLPVAWIRYEETADRHWFYALFAALGLGLASAPLFYGGLVTLAVAAFAQSRIGPPLFDAPRLAWPDRATWRLPLWRAAAVIGGALFVTMSTLLLWHPAGLGAAAALPARWLSQFSLQGELQTLVNPFLAIGRYEIILLILGAVAILWIAWRGQSSLGTLGVYWLTGVFILILLQRGNRHNALLATIPGYLLLGIYANALLTRKVSAMAWGLAGGLLLLGALVFVNVARYTRILVTQPQELATIWIALIAFTFAVVTIYFAGAWDETAAYQGTLLGLLALFIFYQWGTGWWLSHYAANDPRERWVATGADDDVRLLVQVLEDISRQTARSDFELDIFSTVDTPVLRWYLRDFTRLQIGDALPAGADNDVIISPNVTELAPGSDYLGADYGLIRTGLQPQEIPSQSQLLDTFRWWVFHESAAVINEERVILWWRADLSVQ